MKILITGAAGNAGRRVTQELALNPAYALRLADVAPPPVMPGGAEVLRADTRSPADAEAAVRGADAVVHLAAWHCAHTPPVSDETIFAVNVDGTFNVLQASRRHGVKAFVFASSMAWGHWGVYAATKVIGEELTRMFHTVTKTPVVNLRYHDFVPKPYLAHGNMLLFNGVDRADVARATAAALSAALAGRVDYFTTVVHHDAMHAPPDVTDDFAARGPAFLARHVPNAPALLEKYALKLPTKMERHDLSGAARLLGWTPRVNFLTFLNDLARRDAAGEPVHFDVPGELPATP